MILHQSSFIITRSAIFVRRSTTSAAVASSALKLNSKIKQLIESRQYRQALDLFDKQSHLSTNSTITLALKASTLARSYKHGVQIHQQLSKQSLTNPWIQTSLIHFYSEWLAPTG